MIFDPAIFDPAIFDTGSLANRHWPFPELRPPVPWRPQPIVQLDDTDAEWLLLLDPEVI